MCELTNKEKAKITYELLKKRKQQREKKKCIIVSEYMIDKYNRNIKKIFKKRKYKESKSGH
jgi:6-phosphofructokinase